MKRMINLRVVLVLVLVCASMASRSLVSENDVEYEIISPDPGSVIEEHEKPIVALTFFYSGAVIPKDQMRVFFDGDDVTAQAKISSYFVSFVPRNKLYGGEKEIKVLAVEQDGSSRTLVQWSYTQKGEMKKVQPVAVYEEVDMIPAFVGGELALQMFIKENVQYPRNALRRGLSGTVSVEFTVLENGSIVDAVVVRGFDRECDEEALRVIRQMPSWTPGRRNNIPVKARFIQTIQFQTANQARRSAY